MQAMNKKSLSELLQAAEAPLDVPSSTPSEMAVQVRRRRRAQVRGRFAAVSLVAMIGVAATVWAVVGSAKLNPDETPIARPAPRSDNPSPEQPKRLARSMDEDQELRRLRQQQAELESRLAMLLDVEREFQARAKLREISRRRVTADPVIPIADETAILLLAGADLKLRHYGLTKSAKDDYRRVIELFPMSRWASSATARLAAMMP